VPTYQYACTECGHGFEQFQSFSDDALTECPTCGGRLRKVFNSVGIVFKGSGFYRNDSRDAAAKAKDGKPKDGKATESVGSGKSETSGSSETSGKSGGAKSDTSGSGAKSGGSSDKSSSTSGSSSGSTTGSAA
jgi:putative FmdB family regulatory protein